MQRSKSSRARSSFTHRKRQRTPSAVDPIPFPDPALMVEENLKDMIVARINAGEIGAEYIGKQI